MWFKNLRLYCLTQPFEMSEQDLETHLAEKTFVPCATYEKSRIGWVSPLGNDAPVDEEDGVAPMLSHAVGDYIMLCAQKQDRLLPASVVREAAEEQIAEIEQRQGRKIYRKEKRQIQDDVFIALLPRAFTRSTQTFAYISKKEKLLVVNAASAPKAEELLNLLRDTLGTFPVALPESTRAPSDVMTRWLSEQSATDNFEIHEDCELFNPIDGSNIVRCKGQDLVSDEIKAHLDAGKQVKSLGVYWNNLLSCMISDDLAIKRLKFEEMNEEIDSFEEESAAQKFDQEFMLMTLELSNFFKSFFTAFGGLEDPRNKELPVNRSKDKN
jgi:recombination associated protein RdgC